MATYTLNIYYDHTRYQVKTDVCSTWRKVVASVLSARKVSEELDNFMIRKLDGTYTNLDDATDVGCEGKVPEALSFFLEHKDRPEVRFAAG